MAELKPAPKGYPIKLVRDRTEQIINGSSAPGDLFYDELPAESRPLWLRAKLMEEATEYLLAPAPDELADVLSVIEGLAHCHGMTLDDLRALADADPRGGFLKGRMMRGYHPEFDGGPDA